MIWLLIKYIIFISLSNFRDPIAIFNYVIPCVDIKFMPWRWTKFTSLFNGIKKRQQSWRQMGW
jgi:hypothetical protein